MILSFAERRMANPYLTRAYVMVRREASREARVVYGLWWSYVIMFFSIACVSLCHNPRFIKSAMIIISLVSLLLCSNGDSVCMLRQSSTLPSTSYCPRAFISHTFRHWAFASTCSLIAFLKRYGQIYIYIYIH